MKLKYLSDLKKNQKITQGLENPHQPKKNSMGHKSGGQILRYGSDIFAKPKSKVPNSKIASRSKKDY